MTALRKLVAIDVVDDLTADSRCDAGFLCVQRLRVRNRYDDDTESDAYPCDVVSRPGSDAVVAVLYAIEGPRVQVLLREGVRPPVYLRRHKDFVHPDPREYLMVAEVVAGMVEDGDLAGESGQAYRASVEAWEEVGCRIAEHEFRALGGETFASPGTSDEKVYYQAAMTSIENAELPSGDGSVMEEHGRLLRLDLGSAIVACRAGEIPDMKTEIALLRLADHVGYIPQLDCFVDELPVDLRARYRRLGVNATDIE